MANKNLELYAKAQKLLNTEFKKYITAPNKPHDSFLFIGSALNDGELIGGKVEVSNYGSAKNISFLLVTASNDNDKLHEAILLAAKIIREKQIKAELEKYEREAKERGDQPCSACGRYHPVGVHDTSRLPTELQELVTHLRQTINDMGSGDLPTGPLVLRGTFHEIANQLRNLNTQQDANRPNSEPTRTPTSRNIRQRIREVFTGEGQQITGGNIRDNETFEQFVRRTGIEGLVEQPNTDTQNTDASNPPPGEL